jgi:hypothetical protein
MTDFDEPQSAAAASEAPRRLTYPPGDEGFGYIVRRALLAEPMRNARPAYMRELNLLIALDAFRTHGEMSRATVARTTGLRAPTVSKIVQQLVDAGLVVEDGFDAGNGLIRNIIQSLKGEEDPVSSVRTARDNLAACLAFYEAARTGQAVQPRRAPGV